MLLIALLTIFCSHSFGMAEGTGLKFSGAADFLGNFGAKDQTKYPRKFELREAELGFYGPIDHTFDGNVSVAAHNESGAYNLEVHEAHLSSYKLAPNLKAKLGKFFLGVGRLNQFHRHDWPFINAPKSHELFFDEEAAADTGIQLQYLFSQLPIFTELTLGVTSGWTFGHAHNVGAKPIQPTHYARVQNFFELSENGTMQTGLNYLGRNARNDGHLKLFGVDLVAKWRESSTLLWMLQSELWGKNLRPVGGSLDRSFGGYAFVQRHLYQKISGGIRFDGYSVDTSPVLNLDYSVIPILAYKHSEFSQFKLSYQLDWQKREHKDSQTNRTVQLQATFILGDHPAHDF